MIFEDAHWADPTSLELFGRGVNRIENLPVLLLITFRPEFEPPWIGHSNVTALTLNRLTRHDVEAMIDRVIATKQLPANVRQDIIERTDGIPLFVEEMTKAVLEAESQSAAERSNAALSSASGLHATAARSAQPDGAHRSIYAQRHHTGEARQARCPADAKFYATSERGTPFGNALVTE